MTTEARIRRERARGIRLREGRKLMSERLRLAKFIEGQKEKQRKVKSKIIKKLISQRLIKNPQAIYGRGGGTLKLKRNPQKLRNILNAQNSFFDR